MFGSTGRLGRNVTCIWVTEEFSYVPCPSPSAVPLLSLTRFAVASRRLSPSLRTAWSGYDTSLLLELGAGARFDVDDVLIRRTL